MTVKNVTWESMMMLCMNKSAYDNKTALLHHRNRNYWKLYLLSVCCVEIIDENILYFMKNEFQVSLRVIIIKRFTI